MALLLQPWVPLATTVIWLCLLPYACCQSGVTVASAVEFLDALQAGVAHIRITSHLELSSADVRPHVVHLEGRGSGWVQPLLTTQSIEGRCGGVTPPEGFTEPLLEGQCVVVLPESAALEIREHGGLWLDNIALWAGTRTPPGAVTLQSLCVESTVWMSRVAWFGHSHPCLAMLSLGCRLDIADARVTACSPAPPAGVYAEGHSRAWIDQLALFFLANGSAVSLERLTLRGVVLPERTSVVAAGSDVTSSIRLDGISDGSQPGAAMGPTLRGRMLHATRRESLTAYSDTPLVVQTSVGPAFESEPLYEALALFTFAGVERVQAIRESSAEAFPPPALAAASLAPPGGSTTGSGLSSLHKALVALGATGVAIVAAVAAIGFLCVARVRREADNHSLGASSHTARQNTGRTLGLHSEASGLSNKMTVAGSVGGGEGRHADLTASSQDTEPVDPMPVRQTPRDEWGSVAAPGGTRDWTWGADSTADSSADAAAPAPAAPATGSVTVSTAQLPSTLSDALDRLHRRKVPFMRVYTVHAASERRRSGDAVVQRVSQGGTPYDLVLYDSAGAFAEAMARAGAYKGVTMDVQLQRKSVRWGEGGPGGSAFHFPPLAVVAVGRTAREVCASQLLPGAGADPEGNRLVTVMQIIIQTAGCLAKLHKAENGEPGYAHRAVRLDNIMFCAGAGSFRLRSLSTIRRIGSRYVSDRPVPMHAPPEVHAAGARRGGGSAAEALVSAAEDVWALGLAALELLNHGRPALPGAARGEREVRRMMLRGEPLPWEPGAPDQGALLALVPPALKSTLLQCLSRDPRARPTAADLHMRWQCHFDLTTGTLSGPSGGCDIAGLLGGTDEEHRSQLTTVPLTDASWPATP